MIVEADSVAELTDVAGRVLVAGSHGGIVTAHYAAQAWARAAIFNDAGGEAWSRLPVLEARGIAALVERFTAARKTG